MKKYLLPSIKLTAVLLVLICVVYFAIIAGIGKLTSGGGNGKTVTANGRTVGYELIGQKFTDDRYFWGRPSAVDYNAAGSAGSNKGTTNPDYLKTVQDRIDSFLVHHPTVKKEQIPAELVTASGSGLDPHISPEAALIQVDRVAAKRGLDASRIRALVQQHIQKVPLGPDVVNVLRLNIDLDNLH